ncbi:hypothetical protein K432DRAFT_409261 [Lepidopterella palustris CBS 459.81]|uniref:Uncharacterized protein n=1 Tax=Lepidopterella palustris CBS 459.81 TaxID=1314670 RepID=A0A8E2JAU4_9PEZI|nr:hypothetical protein K432DRAFT_409261 [Lepidopterella palustris CBS 459.81]
MPAMFTVLTYDLIMHMRFISRAMSEQGPGGIHDFTTARSSGSHPIEIGICHIPSGYNSVQTSGGPLKRDMVDWQNGSESFPVAAGDVETRPVNMALNFILKIYNNSQLPVGSIMASARSDNTANAQLFQAIGTRFSKLTMSVQTFAIPNLLGQFIRGVDHGVNVDPESDLREPDPDGSKQDRAIACPYVWLQNATTVIDQATGTQMINLKLNESNGKPVADRGINISIPGNSRHNAKLGGPKVSEYEGSQR